MLNLKNFQWYYSSTAHVYKLSFEDPNNSSAWNGLEPSYFLTAIASSDTTLQYNYLEFVLDLEANPPCAYVQLSRDIAVSPNYTHPLQLAFLKQDFEAGTFSFPKIELSSYTSANEVYEALLNTSNNTILHLKHYPLRGNGLYHTLSSMQTLGLTKQEIARDEPFSLLDYRLFAEYFGYNGGGGGHQGSCTYLLGQTGFLPSGVFRQIS